MPWAMHHCSTRMTSRLSWNISIISYSKPLHVPVNSDPRADNNTIKLQSKHSKLRQTAALCWTIIIIVAWKKRQLRMHLELWIKLAQVPTSLKKLSAISPDPSDLSTSTGTHSLTNRVRTLTALSQIYTWSTHWMYQNQRPLPRTHTLSVGASLSRICQSLSVPSIRSRRNFLSKESSQTSWRLEAMLFSSNRLKRLPK